MEALNIQAELFKYDDLIKKFYFNNISVFQHPTISLELEDVLQEMRIIIMKALPKYDSTRGASLSTFFCMHLTDRLKDLRAKIQRRSRRQAGFINDIVSDKEGNNDSNFSTDYLNYKLYENNKVSQMNLADFIDVKIIIERLGPSDRKLFVDRYIFGYSFRELKERHNKSNTCINNRLRMIDKIFETLRFQ